MDYIITDNITSPVDFVNQYSEKLVYMPHSYLIGDHKQMFPHLRGRIILADQISKREMKFVPDNVAVLNGVDLSSISGTTRVEKEIRVIDSNIADSKQSEPAEVILGTMNLYDFEQIEVLDNRKVQLIRTFRYRDKACLI